MLLFQHHQNRKKKKHHLQVARFDRCFSCIRIPVPRVNKKCPTCLLIWWSQETHAPTQIPVRKYTAQCIRIRRKKPLNLSPVFLLGPDQARLITPLGNPSSHFSLGRVFHPLVSCRPKASSLQIDPGDVSQPPKRTRRFLQVKKSKGRYNNGKPIDPFFNSWFILLGGFFTPRFAAKRQVNGSIRWEVLQLSHLQSKPIGTKMVIIPEPCFKNWTAMLQEVESRIRIRNSVRLGVWPLRTFDPRASASDRL